MSGAVGMESSDNGQWEKALAATGGAVANCFQCGTCTAVCPWGNFTQRFNIRETLHRGQLGLKPTEGLWLCTTCAACEVGCPRGVQIVDSVRGLRKLALSSHSAPKGVEPLLWSMFWDGNPLTQPPSERAKWAKGLNVPLFDGKAHEVLLYVGCSGCFDKRSQATTRAMVSLLNAGGVKFGILGDAEKCCGDTARSLGAMGFFEETAIENIATLTQKGANTIVTMSPHCYDVLKNEYPKRGGKFNVLHYTEYLAELVDGGKIKTSKPVGGGVTYHDPCYLGRKNGVYEAPRKVLESVGGVKLTEMSATKANALCCGGGGGRMYMETAAGERFSDLRIQQASATGAQLLVSSCPYCITMFEDSRKTVKGSALQVMEVAELLARAL